MGGGRSDRTAGKLRSCNRGRGAVVGDEDRPVPQSGRRWRWMARRHPQLPVRRRRTARTSPAARSRASFSPSGGSWASVLSVIAVRASRVKNSRAACRVMPSAAPICSQVAPAARADAIRSRRSRFEFRLTTSQFTQRGEGSGRQRMRDDQVHDTSVTSGPEPASRTTGCRSSSASDSVSGLYDGRCVALRPESARRMPIGSRGIPAPLSAPDASHEVPQNRSRRLHADPVRDSVVVGSRVLIRVAAATVRRECPTRGTGVAHEKADHSIHVAS